MKKIPLTQGKFALIDDEDFGRISKYKWYAHKAANTYYAGTNVRIAPGRGAGTFRTLKMHRLLLDAKEDEFVDHIDGNGLNNRRATNLRKCTHIENMRNSSRRSSNKSGFKGVNWHKAANKWIAQIGISKKGKRKNLYIGVFEKQEDAAKAYDLAAKQYHGEFARLNFP